MTVRRVFQCPLKKGRLRTKSGIFDSSLGQKGETTNTQTSDLPGLRAPTWIVPHLKPPTIHAKGRFPGRSPFKTRDRPYQRPFSRMVTFQTRGPSTPEAVFPEGHPYQPGTVHAGTCFPGRSPLLTGDRPHQRAFSRTVAFQN